MADPDGPLAEPLARLGVGWVLVYRDQPGAADLDTTGMSLVVDGRRRGAVPGPGRRDARRRHRPGSASTAVVVAADALWALTGLVAMVGAGVVAVRRRRTGER